MAAQVWQEDFRLMQQAGVWVATIGVFIRVSIQLSEDQFTFGQLGRVLDGLNYHGIKAILVTARVDVSELSFKTNIEDACAAAIIAKLDSSLLANAAYRLAKVLQVVF